MSRPLTISGIDPSTGAGIAVDVIDGKIAALRPDAAADSLYLSPGLIDLQVNGYGGLDFNKPGLTVDTVHDIARTLARLGTTTFLPTLITAAAETIVDALAVIAAARARFPLVARMVPGLHVEGPAISPVDGPRGAHPLAHVRPPSLAEFAAWEKAAPGLARLVTLAPEYPEAPDYIRAVTQRGVHVAIGHTAASPEQVRAAVDSGATLSTHLGNGAASTLPRHPNFIWSQLADDRLTASFIADGHHLPAETLKAMVRAKSLANSILVSDSVSLAGMPPGLYEETVGQKVEVSANGRIGVAGTPYLAGAGLPLAANVAIAIRMADLPLASALQMATANPGRFVGGLGRLEAGQPADLIRFAWQPGAPSLSIAETWIGGERIA